MVSKVFGQIPKFYCDFFPVIFAQCRFSHTLFRETPAQNDKELVGNGLFGNDKNHTNVGKGLPLMAFQRQSSQNLFNLLNEKHRATPFGTWEDQKNPPKIAVFFAIFFFCRP